MTLSARVRTALKSHEPTENVNITIEARNGRVLLSGIVLNPTEKNEVEQVTAQAAGVSGVDSKLRLMSPSRTFTCSKT